MDDTTARRRLNLWASAPDRHSLLEDAQGVLAGSMLVSLGVTLFSAAGLLTGGTVGLAFLVHYGTDLSFGAVFFLVNLPFYYLAFCAIAMTALLSEYMPGFFAFQSINPVAAALFGGLTVAAGMLALFRHRTSLGGFGILALYLQDRFGWRAGLVQLAFDGMVLACSFFVATPFVIICSVLGALVMNLTLAINHRNDRYIAI